MLRTVCNSLKLYLFTVSVLLVSQVSASDETLIWTSQSFALPKWRSCERYISFQQEWTDRTRRYYQHRAQFSVVYRLNDCWSITPAYRHVIKRSRTDVNDVWKGESIPQVDITRQWNASRGQVDYRNRVQYKSRSGDWVYRGRLRFTLPEICECRALRPFVWEEALFSSHEAYTQNRIGIGFKFDVSDSLRGSVSYMALHDKSGQEWCQIDVWRCDLSFKF